MDDAIFEKMVELIRAGNYIQVACAAVGISEASYYRAMGYGRDMESDLSEWDDAEDIFDLIDSGELHAASNRTGLKYSVQDCRMIQFRRAVTRGAAEAEATAVLQLRKQMPQNWQAVVAFLERRFPNRWRKRVEIVDGETIEDGGIDESVLLSDPKAVSLIHDALERVAALPPGEDPMNITVDARDVQEVETKHDDDKGDRS